MNSGSNLLKKEAVVITKVDPIEELASRIDIKLCDACGALRMSDYADLNEGQLDNFKRNDATAVLISTVRRDIGELARTVREGFSTIDERNRSIEERLRKIELKDAADTGKSEGVIQGVSTTLATFRSTVLLLIAVCTALAGVVGWFVRH